MHKFTSLLWAAILTLSLLACSTMAPITNYSNQAVSSGLTQQQVEKAIATAAMRSGWQVNMQKPGFMIATINVRSHSATVNIAYSSSSYSITYKSSSNMEYDGTQIHRNYNRWVNHLNKNIQKILRNAAMANL